MKKNKNFLVSTAINEDFAYILNITANLFWKRLYYIYNYKKLFLNHLRDEYNALKCAFPEVEFIPEARIKSKSSYNSKINKILSSGTFRDIYDIFGNRYIVLSVNGSKNEDDIIPILYKMKDFLSYSSKDSINIENRFKDYIAHPSKVAYQSLHISRLHFPKNHASYQSETQLRSYNMHCNASFGPFGHINFYKKRIPGITNVPELFEYVFDSNGVCIEVREKSKENAFNDFFGIQYI